MKAAYLLAVLGGKVGVEPDEKKVNLLLSEVQDISELIAAGREKLFSVPCGGGAAVGTAPATVGDAAVPAAEEKKEEKKEEESSDEDMGFQSL